MKKNSVNLMAKTGVLVAIVFVFTAYLHIPVHTGYVHIGDAFIYLAACILPLPYAAAVGGLGAFLADCLTGYASWAPASVLIKTATVLCLSGKTPKIICLRNIGGLVPTWLLCVGGYYLYEALITGNFTAPLAGIPGNITQALLSSVLFILLGQALDKMNFKKNMP